MSEAITNRYDVGCVRSETRYHRNKMASAVHFNVTDRNANWAATWKRKSLRCINERRKHLPSLLALWHVRIAIVSSDDFFLAFSDPCDRHSRDEFR